MLDIIFLYIQIFFFNAALSAERLQMITIIVVIIILRITKKTLQKKGQGT